MPGICRVAPLNLVCATKDPVLTSIGKLTTRTGGGVCLQSTCVPGPIAPTVNDRLCVPLGVASFRGGKKFPMSRCKCCGRAVIAMLTPCRGKIVRPRSVVPGIGRSPAARSHRRCWHRTHRCSQFRQIWHRGNQARWAGLLAPPTLHAAQSTPGCRLNNANRKA